MKVFDIEGPLMQGLTKIADLMILNLLTILCCIPIFTAGAAFTALHYQVLKMVRHEECYIARGYFKAFKENFKQATVVWLIMLVIMLVLVGDYYIISQAVAEVAQWFRAVLGAITVFVVFTLVMVFPFMAKFSNTTFQTMKNAMAISIIKFPITILMIIMYAIPPLLGYLVFNLIPLVLLFGISVPAWGSAALYNKFFKQLEDKILAKQAANGELTEENDEDERIFKDELDESLVGKD